MTHARACPVCGVIVEWTKGKPVMATLPNGKTAKVTPLSLVCPEHGPFDNVSEKMNDAWERVERGMSKRTITLSVIYGSFNRGCKLHVVDDSTGRRLGDNRIPQYNLGRAGTFKSVNCKRCRRKLDALIKDSDVTVVDGWTGEEHAVPAPEEPDYELEEHKKEVEELDEEAKRFEADEKALDDWLYENRQENEKK